MSNIFSIEEVLSLFDEFILGNPDANLHSVT